MSIWNPFSWFSQQLSESKDVKATYDITQTSRHNEKHWAPADALSANASMNPVYRRTARNRSRYEAENNSYCAGIIRTLCDHTIGTGPRLNIVSIGDGAVSGGMGRKSHASAKSEKLIQAQKMWDTWARESGLARKLWTMKSTQIRDGECFAQLIGNPAIKGEIKLDINLMEGDYVTQLRPYWSPWTVDGITFDPQWNPIEYHIVTQRPNDLLPIVWPQQSKIAARFILHYFRQERPGQVRGMPEMASALELFAILRRYTLATVSAAEVASSFAAFIKTGAPANADAPTTADSWVTL
jgi:capsid protein